jgi:hypothetical protein
MLKNQNYVEQPEVECCYHCTYCLRIRESFCCRLTKDMEKAYEPVSPIGKCSEFIKNTVSTPRIIEPGKI